MSAEIIHKGSGVQGNAPLATDLELQELGINYNANDPALYIKDSAGAIRRVGGKASTTAAGAVQLTTALNSTSELLAPTASALKNVNDDLQSFKNALTYTRRLYVNTAGNDLNGGTSQATALRTLKRALELSTPGTAILLQTGVYVETCPLIVPRNVGIFGDALRQVTVRPTEATKFDGIFLVDSGFYCFGVTFTGHQQGTSAGVFKTSWVLRFNAAANNLSIGASSFGAYVTRSPYMQNCTSLTARQDDGQGGSVSTGVTGGGLCVDGAECALNSPLRSMVVDSFTQVNLGGPGCLIKNDGFAQLVSFFSTFCEYHVRCETGGQASMSASTSNFGNFSLVADGVSPSPLFTATASGSAGGTVNAINLSAPRFGLEARPLPGLLMRVGSSFYTVTGSVPITNGYRVNFFPALSAAIPNGTTLDFVRRSQISTGGHNMEYVGAGTNYRALPENGGVPIPANEVVETNRGRVFFISFDQLGNLRVGRGFDVDGATGNVTISTENFNLAGLNFIGPFRRDGIFYGEQLREVSNNVDLLSSFNGIPDGNTVPTQNAVKTYVDNKFQVQLISGTNIRSITSNGATTSLLGSGTIDLKTLVSGVTTSSLIGTGNLTFKTINNESLIGTGNITIAAGSGGGTGTGGGGSTAFRQSVIVTPPESSAATLAVTYNSTASSYLISTDTNPDLTFVRGRTYTIGVTATGQPFYIKTIRSLGAGDAYSTGVTNNGAVSGNITFTVPANAPSTLFYQSQFTATAGGVINVVDEGQFKGMITLPKSGLLLRVTTSKPGWFRLYNTNDAANADLLRTRLIDPVAGSGVISEVITTTTNNPVTLSPSAVIANMEVTASNSYSYRFTNDGTSGSLTITLEYLSLES